METAPGLVEGRKPVRLHLLRLARAHLYPRPAFWGVLAVVLAINMAWIYFNPRLSLATQAFVTMGVVFCGTPLALAYRHLRLRPADAALDKLTRILLLALFAGFLTQQLNLFSHLAMSLGLPFADQRLAAWDRALGFDWNAYATAVASHQGLRSVLMLAYSVSIGPAVAIILGVSVWTGRHDRVEELAFLVLASGFICVGIAALFPALSALNTLATPETRALVGPLPQPWLAQMLALRGDGPVSLDLAVMEGIATFPSFHTCLALIIMWCSRGRWPGALAGGALGLAIVAATPVFGGHYGVDLLAGGVLVGALVLLWRRLAPDVRGAGTRP